MGPAPAGQYDPQSLFWRHERLHRAVLQDYAARSALLAAERDALEQEFVAGALALADRPAVERTAFVADCWTKAAEAEARWLAQIEATPPRGRNGLLYRRVWASFNRVVRITLCVTRNT